MHKTQSTNFIKFALYAHLFIFCRHCVFYNLVIDKWFQWNSILEHTIYDRATGKLECKVLEEDKKNYSMCKYISVVVQVNGQTAFRINRNHTSNCLDRQHRSHVYIKQLLKLISWTLRTKQMGNKFFSSQFNWDSFIFYLFARFSVWVWKCVKEREWDEICGFESDCGNRKKFSVALMLIFIWQYVSLWACQ